MASSFRRKYSMSMCAWFSLKRLEQRAYNFNLLSELIFSDLAAALLIQVSSVDARLQLLDFS